LPQALYQMQALLSQRLPCLRPAQIAGLSLWVYGLLVSGRSTQSAVANVLSAWMAFNAARQRLREWLYDGADKARPCAQQVPVSACFAPLLAWALALLPGQTLVLAVDVTFLRARHALLCVSVLTGQTAIPVAWRVGVANAKDAWMTPLLGLLQQLRPALPQRRRVLVLTDRGLWSPRLFKRLKRLGLPPLMRVHNQITFTPAGGTKGRAHTLVPMPDTAWVGAGYAFAGRRRLKATLVALWLAGYAGPCLCLSDLRPRQVDVRWYGLRFWIEAGFRSQKRGGWDVEATRRHDPARVARHWLVLSVATLWTVSAGAQAEAESAASGHGQPGARALSLLQQGRMRLLHALLCGHLLLPSYLLEATLPPLAATLQVIRYKPT